MRLGGIGLLALCGLIAANADTVFAAEPDTVAPTAQAAAPAVPNDPCATAVASGRKGLCVPALTPVLLQLGTPLSTRTTVTSDTFAFTLADPVVVEGRPALAAGVPGGGEVVHAKKTGLGVGGELVLAARYLDLGDRRVRLRSMKLLAQGRDQLKLTMAVTAAVGIPGLFIRGKHIDVPAGSLAEAKLAEPIWLDEAALPAAPAVTAPPEGQLSLQGNAQQ